MAGAVIAAAAAVAWRTRSGRLGRLAALAPLREAKDPLKGTVVLWPTR
jgi:hypothetical protein